MNARILAFPLCAAVVMALDACEGVKPTDPSVKVCHDDTLGVWVVRGADGTTKDVTVIRKADEAHCRKAA